MENQEEYTTLSAQVTAMREEQQALSNVLLESAVGASGLPEQAQTPIRSQYQGKPFAVADLQASIDAARKLITDLTGGSAVQGPRVSQMFSTEDQLTAAVDDLLGAPRDAGKETLHFRPG
jgi:hypothetical protein